MIRQINFNEIERYLSEAKKTGLIFCKSTRLFGYFIDEKLVAFAGLILYSNKAIFKNDYVLPEHRGQGFFKELIDYRINICKKLGIKVAEATCTKMSITEYTRRGFAPIKKYKTFDKVRNENI